MNEIEEDFQFFELVMWVCGHQDIIDIEFKSLQVVEFEKERVEEFKTELFGVCSKY
jgi:hypothetical protein